MGEDRYLKEIDDHIRIGILESKNIRPERLELTVSYSATLVDPSNGRIIARSKAASVCQCEQERRQLSMHLCGYDKRTLNLMPVPWITSAQSAYGFDDKDKTVFRLHGATGIKPGDVQATWFFKDSNDPQIHAITAGRTIYEGDQRQIVFEFPSLRKLRIAKPEPGAVPQYVRHLAISELQGITANDPNDTAWVATENRTFVVRITKQEGEDTYYLFYPWIYAKVDKTEREKAAPKQRSNSTPTADHGREGT
jgi:hypothetical protein